ncbi:MAG: hypothetical protein QM811_27565 [Pirellulales bacterium]
MGWTIGDRSIAPHREVHASLRRENEFPIARNVRNARNAREFKMGRFSDVGEPQTNAGGWIKKTLASLVIVTLVTLVQ